MRRHGAGLALASESPSSQEERDVASSSFVRVGSTTARAGMNKTFERKRAPKRDRNRCLKIIFQDIVFPIRKTLEVQGGAKTSLHRHVVNIDISTIHASKARPEASMAYHKARRESKGRPDPQRW